MDRHGKRETNIISVTDCFCLIRKWMELNDYTPIWKLTEKDRQACVPILLYAGILFANFDTLAFCLDNLLSRNEAKLFCEHNLMYTKILDNFALQIDKLTCFWELIIEYSGEYTADSYCTHYLVEHAIMFESIAVLEWIAENTGRFKPNSRYAKPYMDLASKYGTTRTLQWFYTKFSGNVDHLYTQKAFNACIKTACESTLEWWLKSNLELKISARNLCRFHNGISETVSKLWLKYHPEAIGCEKCKTTVMMVQDPELLHYRERFGLPVYLEGFKYNKEQILPTFEDLEIIVKEKNEDMIDELLKMAYNHGNTILLRWLIKNINDNELVKFYLSRWIFAENNNIQAKIRFPLPENLDIPLLDLLKSLDLLRNDFLQALKEITEDVGFKEDVAVLRWLYYYAKMPHSPYNVDVASHRIFKFVAKKDMILGTDKSAKRIKRYLKEGGFGLIIWRWFTDKMCLRHVRDVTKNNIIARLFLQGNCKY